MLNEKCSVYMHSLFKNQLPGLGLGVRAFNHSTWEALRWALQVQRPLSTYLVSHQPGLRMRPARKANTSWLSLSVCVSELMGTTSLAPNLIFPDASHQCCWFMVLKLSAQSHPPTFSSAPCYFPTSRLNSGCVFIRKQLCGYVLNLVSQTRDFKHLVFETPLFSEDWSFSKRLLCMMLI